MNNNVVENKRGNCGRVNRRRRQLKKSAHAAKKVQAELKSIQVTDLMQVTQVVPLADRIETPFMYIEKTRNGDTYWNMNPFRTGRGFCKPLDYEMKVLEIFSNGRKFVVAKVLYKGIVCVLKARRFSDDYDVREPLEEEYKVLVELNKKGVKNIPTIVDSYQSEQCFVLITGPFGTCFDSINLTVELLSKYQQQLEVILKDIHSAGYIHGDIKPDNLIVDENGDLRVIDFDMAHQIDTKKTDFIGTYGYYSRRTVESKMYTSQDDFDSAKITFMKLNTKVKNPDFVEEYPTLQKLLRSSGVDLNSLCTE